MQQSIKRGQRKGSWNFTFYIALGLLLLVMVAMASIAFGAADMSLATAWGALFDFDPRVTEHQIIRTLRLPRTVADMIVGCSLAVCGAIMQGTTKNPLADSGLMGISSGATFAIALCLAFLPNRTYSMVMFYACIGAALTTGLTYFVASTGRRGMTPQRLVLAGMSISMLFGALSSYLSIKFRLGHALMYWSAGGTAGAKWSELTLIFPFFILAVLGSIALSPSITMLSLGDEVAVGLGLNTKAVKGVSTLIVLVLTGLSVVVVGPVGFVGLIVPHMMRYLVGVDYRYIIPASALYGALLTVVADIIGRLINRPFETPMGIIFSVIGVPFFLYLVKKQRREFE
ncbi:iron ABC transporter permease [uncultured Vagococcus sp.]|uniref:FecCD family ABC transporter permease n=1 Tax=uncultured Vagococcus sp. TaxID=189676 RepID=UPI0028D46016|nr:iron ABC transporter permease [uncultured Vagococcus sp.]